MVKIDSKAELEERHEGPAHEGCTSLRTRRHRADRPDGGADTTASLLPGWGICPGASQLDETAEALDSLLAARPGNLALDGRELQRGDLRGRGVSDLKLEARHLGGVSPGQLAHNGDDLVRKLVLGCRGGWVRRGHRG